jgi:hypothetical protein
MAAIARDSLVCAPQRKIRSLVIELLAAELDDVGIAPQMLRVAGATLHGRSASEPPMEPARCAYVRRDILVAGEAELWLACPIAAVVTVRALLFVLRMSSAELAGHQQRFRIHGLSTPRREQAQQNREHPYGVT